MLFSRLSRLRWQVQQCRWQVLIPLVQLAREAQGDDCAALPSARVALVLSKVTSRRAVRTSTRTITGKKSRVEVLLVGECFWCLFVL